MCACRFRRHNRQYRISPHTKTVSTPSPLSGIPPHKPISKRIYADFNGLQGSEDHPEIEWVPLDTWGSLCDLAAAGIILAEEMQLTIYSDSSEEEDLEADTIARYSDELQCWVAEIDASGIRDVPTFGHENKTLVCVTCRTDLDKFVEAYGLNSNTRCPSCGTIVHLPILPPKKAKP